MRRYAVSPGSTYPSAVLLQEGGGTSCFSGAKSEPADPGQPACIAQGCTPDGGAELAGPE